MNEARKRLIEQTKNDQRELGKTVQIERVRSGKETLDVLWKVLINMPRWKMWLITLLWPDVMKAVKALYQYLVYDGDDDNYVSDMMFDWGIDTDNEALTDTGLGNYREGR